MCIYAVETYTLCCFDKSGDGRKPAAIQSCEPRKIAAHHRNAPYNIVILLSYPADIPIGFTPA